MLRLLVFVALPLVEMAILVWAGSSIGIVPTLLIILATGVLGAVMVKRQGLAVWRSAQQRLATGQMPTEELAHGAMLLVAGAFLLSPGFLTDLTGLTLLIPGVRDYVRRRLGPRMWRRFGQPRQVEVWRV